LAVAASWLVADAVLAHTGTPITLPAEERSPLQVGAEFVEYGVKHILLGYDHLLFLAGLSLLPIGIRDVAAIVGLFALSYSSTLIGGTLLGLAVPGDLIDAVIAVSVGYVGLQIAFGAEGRWWLSRDPRAPALVFGLAHGLGLSSLLQDLQLPGDDVLPSAIGFNVGVELGQIAAIAAFMVALRLGGAFPFPRRESIPAGCALASAASVFLAFVALGLDL
jgi:hydrogenase/urease accessory protein HupE